jgi:ribonuclease HII
MVDLCAQFPGYGFSQHKGYGSAAHMEALRRLGPSPAHRRTFAPVRALLEGVV